MLDCQTGALINRSRNSSGDESSKYDKGSMAVALRPTFQCFYMTLFFPQMTLFKHLHGEIAFKGGLNWAARWRIASNVSNALFLYA